MYPTPAVAGVLRCDRREARKLVKVAGSVFPTTVVGVPVQPRLPATATALGAFEIDLTHAEVIDQVLSSDAAGRVDPGRWADAETQLADWARLYTPGELRTMAEKLVESLDHDGAEPDHELDAQVNELHLTPSPDKIGGRIKGRLDSVTFEALSQALDGLIKPAADEHKSMAQRQADALGELCEHVLDEGVLPECGGEKPHLTVIVQQSELKRGLRGASLTSKGVRIGPREIRRIACDSAIIPLLMGGEAEALDVGRERRTATKYQRRVLAARDGGCCAHPGCTRAANWCSAHHITHWVDGGAPRSTTWSFSALCTTA
jgi:5-methylcytosine-specific restriction protein A